MKNIDGKISIIMPAYNEGLKIKNNIEETIRTFDEFGCEYEIIVIDDGSSDDTYDEALKVSRNYNNVIVKRNMSNYGKGRALKKAFRYVSGQWIVFLDSDMDLHPGQVQTFFDIVKLCDADVVIGSKRHPNSKLDYPLHRKIISSAYFFLIKLMFGLPIRDTQTGLKLFKYEVLKQVFPKILVKKFAFDLEILVNAHHLGFNIAEAPVVLNSQRKFGRINFRTIYITWWDTMAIFYRMYILKYYGKPKSRSLYAENPKRD